VGENTENIPKYYQTGLRPQASLKPIQEQALNQFKEQLLSPETSFDEFRYLLSQPLPAIIGQLFLTVFKKPSSGLLDMFNTVRFTVNLSGQSTPLIVVHKSPHNPKSLLLMPQLGSMHAAKQTSLDKHPYPPLAENQPSILPSTFICSNKKSQLALTELMDKPG